MRAVMGCQHRLPIGALYNRGHSTPGSLRNPHHSHHPSTQAMSIRSQHQCPTRAVHHCATVPSSTKYREHHKAKRRSTAQPHPIQKPSRESSPYLPRFPLTKKKKKATRLRLERERPQRAVNIQARCGKTSSSRPRRLGIAVCQISSCLGKIRVMCLGHLSHPVRLRQPRLRRHYRHRR